MKKNVIAVMLSLVLAVGSTGAPVFAAEEGVTTEVAVKEVTDKESMKEVDSEEVGAQKTTDEVLEDESLENSEKESAEIPAEEQVTIEDDAEEEVLEPDTDKDSEDFQKSSDNEDEEETEINNVQEESDAGVTVKTASSIASSIVFSGTCYENLSWELYDDGTLTISGQGGLYGDFHADDYWESKTIDAERNIIYYGSTDDVWDVLNELVTRIVIEEGVTYIGTFFWEGGLDNQVEEVDIPKSVTMINSEGLYNLVKLKKIIIRSSSTEFGEGRVLYPGNLTDVYVPDLSYWVKYGAMFGSEYSDYHGARDWDDYNGYNLYINNELVTELTITEDMQNRISTYNEELTHYGCATFGYCGSLESVIIEEGVKDILPCEFFCCKNLTSVTIPVSMTNIKYEAFYGCSSLANVYYNGSQLQWNAINISEYNDPLLKIKPQTSEEKIPLYNAVLNKDTYPYKGSPVIPDVTVYRDETTVAEEGVDYTLSYANNEAVGTGTVTVTGIGDFTGSFELSFTIVEVTLAVEYLEVGIGGNVTVHWIYNGEADAITGFEVQHRWKGSDGIRTTKVSGSDKREVDIVNLSYNDYEFRVRAVSSSGEESEDSEWTDWAECPVKEIKLLNPVPGSSFAELLGVAAEIDFGAPVKTTGKGALEIYGNNNESVQKITLNMDPVNYQSSPSKLSINNVNSLPISSSSINTIWTNPYTLSGSYHISISEKTIEYFKKDEEATEEYTCPVYFAGIPSSDRTWQYTVVSQSYSRLRNPRDCIIPDSYYKIFYGPQHWRDINNLDNGKKGVCFGLCYAMYALSKNHSGISAIAGNHQLAELPCGEGSDLFEYVQKAHTLQYSRTIQEIKNRNLNKVKKVYEAVKNNEPIVIGVGGSDGGHTIYPLGIISDNDEVQIAVYNCNGADYENDGRKTMIQTLTIYKAERDEDWSYHFKYFNDDISFVPLSFLIDDLIYTSSPVEKAEEVAHDILATFKKETEHSQNEVVPRILETNNGSLTPISSMNGDVEESDTWYYWYNGTKYHFDGDDEDITVTLSDGTNKIYATLAAEQSATLDIENKLVTIDGAEAGGTAGDYVIRFSEAEDYDTFHDMEISGTSGNEDTKLTKTDDGITVDTDAGAEIIVRKIENNENTAEVKAELPEDKAEIRTDDNGKISVYADKDGDGEFTDVIAVSGNSGTTEIVASGTCGENLTWKLDDEGTLTIFGEGEMEDLDYEESSWASYEVKKAIFDEGVTSIGNFAFFLCSSLTNVTIPNSVTSIGDYAFYDCRSLTSVKIPDSVTSIGENAFVGCSSLTSVTIPDSVTSIGENAFGGCSSLTNVTIPDSVTSIGNGIFFDCNNLTSVTISDSVTSIGEYAFGGCSSLTSVKIPDSVTNLGYGAFAECSSLTSVTIGNSVTSIGDGAFYECSGLTSVTIPKSVKSIGWTAFYKCTKLKDVYYSGSKIDWDAISINDDNTCLTDATIHYAKKVANKITASNRTLSYSTKARTLTINARATAGKITYKSNNSKVKVTSAGKVTIPAKFTGTVKITISTAGNSIYSTATKTITITVPAKITLSSVSSPSAGKMRVVWKKNTSVTGYQIQYSIKSSFASPKTVTVGKNTQYAKTISGLTKGKKYYVRIRSYKTVSGKKYYSAWSATKATTIKK